MTGDLERLAGGREQSPTQMVYTFLFFLNNLSPSDFLQGFYRVCLARCLRVPSLGRASAQVKGSFLSSGH